MRYTISRCRRRGVATFFAVAALGLVATAVLAMSTVLRIDHRRTQASLVDAQLRQLLLAGADAAAQGLDAGTAGENWTAVDLPVGLGELGGSARWRLEPAGTTPPTADEHRVAVVIDAGYGEESAGQLLIFGRHPDAAGHSLRSAVYRP